MWAGFDSIRDWLCVTGIAKAGVSVVRKACVGKTARPCNGRRNKPSRSGKAEKKSGRVSKVEGEARAAGGCEGWGVWGAPEIESSWRR
ncbi:MAG: hypothetical protein ACKESB_02755 [Candidatus Hodgkinia cicadicola]